MQDKAEPRSKRSKSVLVALVSDGAIAAVKVFAAIVTGSSAMTSEAIHSVVDALNSILLLVGERRSRRPADAEHPLGHGREIYFWTLLVAVSIFAGGGAMSFYEGVVHLITPLPLQPSKWSYVVLGVAAAFEAWACVSAYREHRGSKRRREGGLWQEFRASKDLTNFAVLFENGAALVGVAIAFAGIFASHLLGRSYPDAIASLLIGTVLIVVAYFLIRESKGLLVGERADPRVDAEMRAIATKNEAIEEVLDLITLQFGPHQVLVMMDVRFRDRLSSREVTATISNVERAFHERFPDVKRIFVEASCITSQ